MQPKKGPQRNLDPRAELPHHAPGIEPDNLHPRSLKILRQHAPLGDEAGEAVGNDQLDLLDAHFERIARLGAFDEDRPGENVPGRPLVLHGADDFPQRRLDFLGGQKRALQPLRRTGEKRLHLHRIARFDREHRFRRRIVVAPQYRLGSGFQRMNDGLGGPLGLLAFQGKGDECQQARRQERHQCSHGDLAFRGPIIAAPSAD
jgi:hypothetical protein